MIASIRELLKKEFGKNLGDEGVHFLDPFTGTGNFVVHLMREIPKTALPRKYAGELWANEIMLLPYYIAGLNIEHAYFEATGRYQPFPGLCLVDTFELAEPHEAEFEFMTAANTERVNAQKKAPIRVIMGNPPYNAWQQDENDNNKNRKYQHLDRRVRNTYAADSAATLKNSLSDPYIKAIRWASDRIGDGGIVAFVTNNGYLDGIAADGVRQHLAADFDTIYLVDLGGNVRKNPKLSGTTHNVFGIQVGVSIALFVRRQQKELKRRQAVIRYAAADVDWRKEQKWKWLEEKRHVDGLRWRKLTPDERHSWLHDDESSQFFGFVPVGSKSTKDLNSLETRAIFRTFALGSHSSRDEIVYDFDRSRLAQRANEFTDAYNAEVDRYRQKQPEIKDLDAFLRTDLVKWSETLKRRLVAEERATFDLKWVSDVSYRPFTKRCAYLDPIFIDRPGVARIARVADGEFRNLLICLTDSGSEKPFVALACVGVVDLHLVSAGASTQCFPLHTHDADGGHRRDNVTDWALEQFQARYPKAKVTKRDIFHYVYAILHHPVYREKYAANLRRELPRIPFAPDFSGLSEAGRRLAELHAGYEQQKEYPLTRIEAEGVPLDLRAERMKLSKDRTALIYNRFLILEGLPPEVHEYRLGNRSALEWIIDQYRVRRAKDDPEKILSDPNRADDPEYILRLIGQVVAVSVETVRIVKTLPPME